MAKFNPILGDIRGSIGANCFAVNRSGAYIRFKASPTQPNTQWQTQMRARVLELSKWYSYNLTEDEREAWIAFAQQTPKVDRFGRSQIPTGLNMFVALNIYRFLAGQGIITRPPDRWSVRDIATVNLRITREGTPPVLRIKIEFTYAEPVPIGQKLFVFASLPVPPGTKFYKNYMRFLKVTDEDPPSPLDITADYIARFGEPPPNTRIHVVVAAYNPRESCRGRGISDSAVVPPPA